MKNMSSKISFQNKKVIIFDLDGTIVQLAVDWDALKDILSNRYSKIYQVNSCEFNSISRCLDYIVEREDEEELITFFEIIRSHETANLEENEEIEEVLYFITHLSEFGISDDTRLAVLSLNTRETIIQSLKNAEIYEKFDFIVGREDVRKWKPDPEGLLKIREHYGLKKNQLIYFGDMKKDLQTGRNAGIDAYYIDEIIEIVRKKQNN